MSKLVVAVAGDSIMWGQGLGEADKFVTISAKQIGDLLGKAPEIHWLSTHSGAHITAEDRQRPGFANTYPELFRDESARDAFLSGDEDAALPLHGEIPRAFPTISHQVAQIDPAFGATVDLLYVDGGANDIGFSEILTPGDQRYWRIFDPLFLAVCYSHMRDLLRTARSKCPRATIIVTGYYSALSSESSKARIKTFLESQSGKDVLLLGLNDLLNKFNLGTDINAIGNAVKARSEYGHTRALFHISRAVIEANLASGRKHPGIIFVNPGFGPENAVFAANSFVHQEYAVNSVTDSQKPVRQQNCPRAKLLKGLWKAYLDLILHKAEAIDWIIYNMNGPQSLLDSARDRDPDKVMNEVKIEIARITDCLIASFIHPNEAGAAQYAKRVVDRYRKYKCRGIRDDVRKLVARQLDPLKTPDTWSVKYALRRFGLKPQLGLRHCMQHMDVDSIAVRLTTRAGKATSTFVSFEIPDEIALLFNVPKFVAQTFKFPVVFGPGFRLNDEVGELSAGARDFFTIDARGVIHLGYLRGLTLRRVVSSAGQHTKTWTPGSITLMINGTEVFSAQIDRPLGANKSVSLPYPAA